MATLRETLIQGDFRAEDQVLDLTDQLRDAANDPDTAIPGLSGFRVNRGSEEAVGFFWDEDTDTLRGGPESNPLRILTEGDLIAQELTLAEGANISISRNESTGETVIGALASPGEGAVQFNRGGLLSADPGLSYDESTQLLTATGGVDVGQGAAYSVGGESAVYIEGGATAIGAYAREVVDLAGPSLANTYIGSSGDTPTSLQGTQNIVIGDFAVSELNTNFNTYIGYAAGGGGHRLDASDARGPIDSNIYLGAYAGWGSGAARTSTFIGVSAGLRFNEDSSIGLPWNNVAIGASAMRRATAAQSFALGTSSMSGFPGGQTNVYIGNFSGVSRNDYTQPAVSSCIVLGDGAHSTASNQMVIGTPGDKGPTAPRIREVFIGQGVEALNPENITIHSTRAHIITPTDSLGTGGKNPSKRGGDITLQPGEGAGDAEGSALIVRTPTSSNVDEYALQPTEERVNVSERGTVFRNANVFIEDADQLPAGPTDEVLIRDPSTGRITAAPAASLASSEIEAGNSITITLNASTGASTVSVDVPGADTELVFNDAGALGASQGLRYDGSDLLLGAAGAGIVVHSSDGTPWRLRVQNDGTVLSEELST